MEKNIIQPGQIWDLTHMKCNNRPFDDKKVMLKAGDYSVKLESDTTMYIHTGFLIRKSITKRSLAFKLKKIIQYDYPELKSIRMDVLILFDGYYLGGWILE